MPLAFSSLANDGVERSTYQTILSGGRLSPMAGSFPPSVFREGD
jgi:hypothetical protein